MSNSIGYSYALMPPFGAKRILSRASDPPGGRAVMAIRRMERFCNTPTCELCDVILRPQDTLKKGGVEVCPRCLEEVIVRPHQPSLSATKAAARRSPSLR